MILSKAISISRRKRELSVILLLMLLPLSLGAASFRVAAVSDDPGYNAMMLDALSVLSGEVTSPEAVIARKERDARAEEIREAKEISRLRRAESDEERTDDGNAEDESLVLEIAEDPFSETEKNFLLSGDREAFRYLMYRENLDMIIAADAEEEGLMTSLELYIDGDEVYRSLYTSDGEESEFMNLLSILLPRLKNEETVIVRSSLPITAAIEADGERITPVNGLFTLTRGGHRMKLSMPFSQDVEMTFDAEEGAVLSAEFVPVFSGAIFVSSVPYDADLYYQGELLGTHTIEEGRVPFQITAARYGFSPYTLQSRIAMDRVSIQLRPAWMAEEDIVERAKTRFYNNLLTVLVSFGGYVASGSMEDIFPDASLAPVTALAAGFGIVQLVELVDSMFDYFQAARLGI